MEDRTKPDTEKQPDVTLRLGGRVTTFAVREWRFYEHNKKNHGLAGNMFRAQAWRKK